jgi:glycosyltransferase involved in cell wall biosynthesis
MKEIYYWSPCLEKVGTYWSTMNSAVSIAKYSKENFSVKILNVCGEWDSQKKFLEENNVKLIDLGLNYYRFLPKSGFLKSRFSFIVIFILSIFPLIYFLKVKKPEFFVIHLITSLPIILFSFFYFKTKLILRISGFPKLNFLRKFLWKMVSKKVYKISCPSIDLINQLSIMKIFLTDKIFFLPDPIIRVAKFINDLNSLKKVNYKKPKRNYFISVGRLTKQKNFKYLINEFKAFIRNNEEIDLLIFGEGEEKKNLLKQIKDYNLTKRIFLMGYSDLVYAYMKNAQAFILSSLWEDPGFVIVEAGMCNLFIISSNCKNGPSEFLQNGKGGILFESNKEDSLKNALDEFFLPNQNHDVKKLLTKKNCLKYTLLRHFEIFNKNLIND